MGRIKILFVFAQILLLMHQAHAGFSEGAPCSSRNTFLLSTRDVHVPKTIQCVDIKTRRSLYKYFHLFRNATTLYADNMNLKKLPIGVINHMPRMELADFSKNKLTNFPPTIFNKHQNLQKLLLTENYIQIPKQTPLIYSKTLTTLQLTSNGIKELFPKTFAFLPRLEVLYLGENRIKEIVPAVFKPLRNLKYLDLSNNNLMVKPSLQVRLALPRTLLKEYLILNGNPFNEFENEVFDDVYVDYKF